MINQARHTNFDCSRGWKVPELHAAVAGCYLERRFWGRERAARCEMALDVESVLDDGGEWTRRS